ncbi:UDP-GlcNAc:betaGal beta-13-N-acetylglucosaminyltransferase 9 [Taenia solium]
MMQFASSYPSVSCKIALFIIILCTFTIYLLNVNNIYFKIGTKEDWLVRPASYNTYCEWNDSILANAVGQYELHLCYKRAHLKPGLVTANATIEESKIRTNGSSRRLRFEELVSIPDSEWLENFDRGVYLLYPQSIQIRETLQSLFKGKPISEPPIFNPRIRFLHVPTNVCSPLTPTQAKVGLTDGSPRPNVVIVYKSGVYNFEERSHLRQLYHLSNTNISIHLIFSIGLPRSVLSNVFQRDGFNVTLRNRAGQKLMGHSHFPMRTKRMLLKEMYDHDDLLIGDYEDSYYNLSLKLFHTFQWAARFCRPYKPIFVFLDDDYAVNTNKLVNFVRNSTPKSRENLYHGYVVDVNPVLRPSNTSSRWAFSKREIPWPMHMPEYMGIYSMWSYCHVNDIALAMHFTKPTVVDDIWLGMVQYKLNLTFQSLDGMFSEVSPIEDHVNCSDIFFALISEFERRRCNL